MEYLLEMRDIQKSFPGVKALDRVQLCVRGGTVHALMGENGAGKSTLMKCLFGIYHKDAGSIRIEGHEVSFTGPRDAMEHGVAMVHQELNQAVKRSVTDNIWLGRYPTRFGIISEKKMYNDTVRLFRDLDIDIDPNVILSRLSVAQRQMVEIAKAVSYHAKILVLDEPTSSLNESEVEHLFRIVRKLRERGCGIIYISHKMDEILAISDDVTIMRDGQYIATEAADRLSTEQIIRMMVGRPMKNLYPPYENTVGGEFLRVEHLGARFQKIHDISFTLRQGEVLGFAGLVGAGRTEILETLFGVDEKETGKIFLRGKEIFIRRPSDAIRNGLALLTEERRASGIFAGLSVRENVCISHLSAYRNTLGFLSDRKMERDADHCVKALRVKTPGLFTPIRSLSGGNQQKVIFGRWMLTEPEILLLDEPTRGIDVGAKYEIYQLIFSMKKEGKGVILVSSEMPEIMGMCDRILVLSGGRIAGEVERGDFSQEKIMALAAKFV